VVLVVQRLERGPVESRQGAFPKHAWRTEDLKARRVKVSQGLDLKIGDFGDDGSMFIKYRRRSSIVGDQKRTERF